MERAILDRYPFRVFLGRVFPLHVGQRTPAKQFKALYSINSVSVVRPVNRDFLGNGVHAKHLQLKSMARQTETSLVVWQSYSFIVID